MLFNKKIYDRGRVVLMLFKKRKLATLMQIALSVLFVLQFALGGCGGDGGAGIVENNDDSMFSEDEVITVEPALYLPLNTSSSLVYSNGEKVYEAKYIGEVNAAGVRAVKFGSTDTYNLFSVDSNSITLCGTESLVFDAPITIFSNKTNLYEENTSSVTINGVKNFVSSYFTGREKVTTEAGTFNTLRFQTFFMKSETGEVNFERVMNLAKNVGIVADKIIVSGRENATTLIAGTTDTAVFSKPKKEWAFLIYACGHNPSNDLSTQLYNQLKQFGNTGIGKSAYVVAQIAPSNAVLSGRATRFALTDDQLVAVRTITERTVNTGATSEIISFYNWAIDAYPAEHYALFISGHGSGAISILYPQGEIGAPAKAIAYDDPAKDSLKLYELSETYRAVTAKLGKKADIIVFDSCVMQMFEVAYQLKDFAEYFVASQAAQTGYGIDMLAFSKKFTTDSDHSPLGVSRMLVDAYIDSTSTTNVDTTMSVTKLSMCDQLRKLLDSFADGINEIKSDTDSVAFVLAVYGSQRFGSLDYNDYASCYVDLFEFAATLEKYIDSGPAKTAAASLLEIAKEKSFVVYNRVKGEYFKSAGGVSIFIPLQSKDWINSNYTRDQYRYFTDFGRDGKWYDFLNGWSTQLGNNGL